MTNKIWINRLLRRPASFCAFLGLMAGLAASCPAAAEQKEDPLDILVIVNMHVQVSAVTVDSVRNFFLKNKIYWSSSENIVAINSTDTGLRDAFRAKVIRMSQADEQRYWRDEQMRGNKTEPIAFANTQKAVFSLKGAISYVFRKDYREGVSKVVLTIPANAR